MISVSVIVPIYNNEKYLSKCIDSLIEQSLQDIEIILIDDGSTDGCQSICERYIKKYDNVVYRRIENSGVGAARNLGISIANGEYVGFVDSDDFVCKDMFYTMYNNCKKDDTDIAICNMKLVHEEVGFEELVETGLSQLYTFKLNDNRVSELVKFYQNVNIMIAASSCVKIFRKHFLLEHNLLFTCLTKVVSEDFYFSARALARANGVSVIPKYFYSYVQHNDSYVHQVNPQFQERMINMLYELFLDYTQLGLDNVWRQFKKYYTVDDKQKIMDFYHLKSGSFSRNDYKILERELRALMIFCSILLKQNSRIATFIFNSIHKIKYSLLAKLIKAKASKPIAYYYWKKSKRSN